MSPVISIHAAREGGDSIYDVIETINIISIHAAREGGDYMGSDFAGSMEISIHAAREGGDLQFVVWYNAIVDFNPRRP